MFKKSLVRETMDKKYNRLSPTQMLVDFHGNVLFSVLWLSAHRNTANLVEIVCYILFASDLDQFVLIGGVI